MMEESFWNLKCITLSIGLLQWNELVEYIFFCASYGDDGNIIIRWSANPKPEAIGHTSRASAATNAGPAVLCGFILLFVFAGLR